VQIWAASQARQAGCPSCDHPSTRIHSHYQRRLVDAAIGGHRVTIRLRMRRFFCDHHGCPTRTFAEQIPA
jgi:transposase